MAAKEANRRTGSKGVFDTKGGKSYLENLMSLSPSDQTLKAVEKLKAGGSEGHTKQGRRHNT